MSQLSCSAQPEVNNQKSLQEIAWAITMSQGRFSLMLARCNYTNLRKRLAQQLHQICSVEIREIILQPDVHQLYSHIQQELAEEKPAAVMVLGLESVQDIDALLTSMNQVREEFRKYCPFPLILWVNDQIVAKLIRLVPDIESWAKHTGFAIATDELLKVLRQESDRLFASVLDKGAESFLSNETIFGSRYPWELDAALRDLDYCNQTLTPDLEACLQFVRGRDDYASDRLDKALAEYKTSLSFWQQSNHRLRQAVLLFYIGLCHERQAQLERSKRFEYWQTARSNFEDCLHLIEQVQRGDLVARFINQLCQVLQYLEQWDELQKLAEKSQRLHKTHGTSVQLAQDYGSLAHVALQRQNSDQAKELAEKALHILDTLPAEQHQDQCWYLLILARSLRQIGQLEDAICCLEKAKTSDAGENPQLYIQMLKELRSLYFDQGQYLEAFKVKQYRYSIEHQFGFRAFIGAGQLKAERQAKLVLNQYRHLPTVAEEIFASGRDKNIKKLIEWIGDTCHKLIIIYGPSGVGKSSMVEAGLVPALKQTMIGTRKVLSVTLRTYTNWQRELGKGIARALVVAGVKTRLSVENGGSPVELLEQLQDNEQSNLLTVLIFDQLEEFFFVCSNPRECQDFFEFLRDCLNCSSVKVVISLREDYLHLLLQGSRKHPIDAINNDILSKNILYYVGNFSPPETKSIFLKLTQSSQFYMEEALIDELVKELDHNEPLGEVRPIELQIMGAQLCTYDITTLAKYQKPKYKGKLVQRYLEDVIKDCGRENESIAELVLFLLTDENNPRPLKTIDDLRKGVFNLLTDEDDSHPLKTLNNLKKELFSESSTAEADQLNVVLSILVESGLVVMLRLHSTQYYQLVHDYLASFVRKQKITGLLVEIQTEREERERERKRLERIQTQLNKVLQQKLRIQRGLMAIGGISFIVVLLGLQYQSHKKEIAEIEQTIEKSETLFATHQELDALKEAVWAWQRLPKLEQPSLLNLGQSPAEIKLDVEQMLQRAVSGFKEYQEYNSLEGHKDAVIHVAFSPGGKTIATASFDHTVKLWQLDGKLIPTREKDEDGKDEEKIKHEEKINSLAFSPDGKMIATASFDNTVKLWTLDGTLVRTFTGHNDGVFGVDFSRDGRIIATASGDKTIKLWRIKDGKLLKTLTGHEDVVDTIAFSPKGQIIASASWDGTVKLWRTTDDKSFRTLRDETLKEDKSHSDRVFGVAFSPDGQMIASVSWDNTAKLWNIDGKLRYRLNDHTNRVIRVDFSPDGKRIATTSWDQTIKLWSTKEGILLETLEGHTDGVFGVEFGPYGEMIATSSQDNTVKLWKHDTSLNKRILKNHSEEIYSIDFSPDNQRIATASEDGTVKVWKTDGTLEKTLKGHQSGVYKVVFSPDGTLIATASFDDTVKIWQADGTPLATLVGQTEEINSLAFSRDHQILATANKDKTVKLWKLDGTSVDTLKGHRDQVQGIAFSRDGTLIATASWDDEGILWNRAGESLAILNGHSGEVNGVAFSRDGNIIATVGKDKTARLWNREGKLLETLDGHTAEVNGVAFSRDGKIIATMSKDKTVKLWNRDGELLHTLSGPRDLDWQVRFKSESELIASAIDNNTVILWNVELLQPNQLIERSCDRLRDYLQNNPSLDQSDRDLCDGISSQKSSP
jgi:WD40 repeat protein/archaellum biogenesis ATPase FlaH